MLADWLNYHPEFGAAWDRMRRDQADFRRADVQRRERRRRAWDASHARAAGRPPRAKAGHKGTWARARGGRSAR